MWQKKVKENMRVRSKDWIHLFSLDNLLDFLHKKADITNCWSHITPREESLTPALWWNGGWMCGNETDIETKMWEKTMKGRNVKVNSTVWTFLHSHEKHYAFFWFSKYAVRDVHVQQTFADPQQTSVRSFCSFFNMCSGKRKSGDDGECLRNVRDDGKG